VRRVRPGPDEGENAQDEWRADLDVDDDLPTSCPQCAEREFRRGLTLRAYFPLKNE
jgi:hypothetical protein